MASNSAVDMCGHAYLYRREERRRWLLLTGDTLFVFADLPQFTPVASLDLRCARLVATSAPRELQLHTAGRDYHLRASDKDEANAWVNTIKAAKARQDETLVETGKQWLRHLNSCLAAGCRHGKCLRGYCRPHFRLFFGEDPEVEVARCASLGSGKQQAGPTSHLLRTTSDVDANLVVRRDDSSCDDAGAKGDEAGDAAAQRGAAGAAARRGGGI